MQMKVYFQFAEREQARPEVKADSYARAISADAHTACLSSALRENEMKEYYDQHFGCIIGKKLMMPTEYLPSRDFLAYHRKQVFVGV